MILIRPDFEVDPNGIAEKPRGQELSAKSFAQATAAKSRRIFDSRPTDLTLISLPASDKDDVCWKRYRSDCDPFSVAFLQPSEITAEEIRDNLFPSFTVLRQPFLTVKAEVKPLCRL